MAIQESPLIGPLINTMSRCPATILAANRTDNVIGRITFLISSIMTIKGIRTYGVPIGTKCAKNLFIFLTVENNINPNQMDKAKEILKVK